MRRCIKPLGVVHGAVCLRMQASRDCGFTTCEHTFITFMAERGVPLPVVQNMVGHMSARMTRYYTHISSQAARKVVELLDQPQFVGKFVGKQETTNAADAK